MATITRIAEGEPGGRTVVVLPGGGYTVQMPLLYWSALALHDAGWTVWAVDYHADIDDAVLADLSGFMQRVLQQVDATLPEPPAAVIAKSLGTYALPEYVARGVRGLWFTPLLPVAEIADALRGADERQFAVGGADDPSWLPSAIAGTRAHVMTLPDADHGLLVPGRWERSAAEQLPAIRAGVANLLRR